METTRIVVCECGVPARIREIPYDLGGTTLRDWAPCPWCYRKLFQMEDEGIVIIELITAEEWE